MRYISFDIETIPGDFEELSESQQEYWLRGASTYEERDKKKGEMALTALTGRVVCICLALFTIDENGNKVIEKKMAFSVDNSEDSFVLSNSEELPKEKTKTQLSDGSECLIGSEEWLLQIFWKIIEKYKDCTLVSFNGRGFDAPFLMHRSAIYHLRPTRNLMEGTKFNYSKHIDLLDELTFYSPSSSGPTRRFNFDFYARAFGIVSPKAEGVDGSKVSDYFAQGKIIEIAEYCLRDVVATIELFEFWNKYLNFKR